MLTDDRLHGIYDDVFGAWGPETAVRDCETRALRAVADAAVADARPEGTVLIRVPMMAPLSTPVTRDAVREAWDAFVVPTQQDDAPPQSQEDRILMAILRTLYDALPPTEAEPIEAEPIEDAQEKRARDGR